MKRLILSVLIFMFCVGLVSAEEPTGVKWGASTGTVETYKVYYNDNSKLTTELFMLFADMKLSSGIKYSIEVTALNSSGESKRSNMVTYTPPSTIFTEDPAVNIDIPGIPKTLILNFITPLVNGQ